MGEASGLEPSAGIQRLAGIRLAADEIIQPIERFFDELEGGLNLVGLRRRGFSKDNIDVIDRFYDTLYRRGLNVSDALATYERENEQVDPMVTEIIAFIRASSRGICKSAAGRH